MKGSETKLIKYMEGADKRFVIPVYQRNYDWKIENCKQFYDDLVTEHIGGSNLTTNYNYFYDRIQKEEITIDELFRSI